MISRRGHYEPIAREGYPFVAPLVLAAVVLWWFGYSSASFGFLAMAVPVALFFRNPERVTPSGGDVVICPADGRVVEIVEDAQSRHIPGIELRRISVFMSPFNVHVNRWPASGTVTHIAYSPGGFLDARDPRASMSNEHNAVVLQSEHGPLEVVQIAGFIARRIVCWAREGDQVLQGDRLGLIRFGSRVDVYMPKSFSPSVAVGAKVKAGVTILAHKSG